ncbi:zinc finger and BTB domain-containing protein 8A [Lepisosteus oculatus]|uniref:Zinc finger and BTB domain containing 8A n=1 Tax=Lepisosteus oculatus TaxID=7918 RepID=W5LW78_LEPOC|nr:PREDICTED: zinc finger and BTB domain-containing protein 8A-like [Lepisosteus oculatus]XP_006643504.2 PREDICTED: zinc finger and BTB domain-containing protein 8A-like [Lepisosteus oculatus]
MDILSEMRTKGSSQTPGEPGQPHPSRVSALSADISSSHQSRLLQQLDEQRRQELFCDCSVLVEGRVFKAHRNVLFASSGYFRMLLSQGAQDCGQPVSASFEVFSQDTFTVILDFMYSGKLDLTSTNVIEVMSAASYLQMTDVIGYCKSFIKSSLDISAKEEDDHYLSLSENASRSGGVREPQDYSSSNAGAMLKSPSSSQPASWHIYNSPEVDYHKETKSEPEPAKRGSSPSEQPSRRMGRRALQIADPELHASPGGYQFSLGPEGGAGETGKKKDWSIQPAATRSSSELKGAPSRPKAEKADELYNTLPTIVGVVGLFNRDECPTMRFKCPFCTHTVKRKADLKRHLRCHTGERPYPCEACSKRFTRLEHLRSHFQTIHQARKLICRKCKRQVTELSGRVVCEGTRRYRLCNECLLESGCDSVVFDSSDPAGGVMGPYFGEEEGDKGWPMTDEDDLAEDSGADLIIQEVEDSDEELEQKETKPVVS